MQAQHVKKAVNLIRELRATLASLGPVHNQTYDLAAIDTALSIIARDIGAEYARLHPDREMSNVPSRND